MKVLHLGKYYPPVYGGFETHLGLLASGLADSGLNVRVVVSDVGFTRRDEVDSGVRITRLPRFAEFFGAPLYTGIAKCIREERPDIVHLHWPNPCSILGYLRSGHKGLLVVTYHSDVIGREVLQKGFAPFLRAVLERAAVILPTSFNYMVSSVVLSPYVSKCRVVSLGISPEESDHSNDAEVAAIRERFPKPIVLAVGRLVRYKGFEYLIRAMRGVNAQLVIIGEGPLREELQEEIVQSCVQDRAVILPRVDDVKPYYCASKMFVLPSVTRAEAFGIVQLEAMTAGKPVINTALPTGVTYVSMDGVTGLTVPPRAPQALSVAINRFLNDPAMARDFGLAGQERVRTLFDAHAMVRSVCEIYREVAI
jgi:glycosyltransferase involved in cell wall biosynthesis